MIKFINSANLYARGDVQIKRTLFPKVSKLQNLISYIGIGATVLALNSCTNSAVRHNATKGVSSEACAKINGILEDLGGCSTTKVENNMGLIFQPTQNGCKFIVLRDSDLGNNDSVREFDYKMNCDDLINSITIPKQII